VGHVYLRTLAGVQVALPKRKPILSLKPLCDLDTTMTEGSRTFGHGAQCKTGYSTILILIRERLRFMVLAPIPFTAVSSSAE